MASRRGWFNSWQERRPWQAAGHHQMPPSDKSHSSARQASTTFTRDLFAWLNQVQGDPDITAAVFVTAYTIGQYINRTTRKAWPSQKTLAAEARVTVRGLQKAIDKLVNRGHLAVEVYGGAISRGPRPTNAYRMMLQEERKHEPPFAINDEPPFAFDDVQARTEERPRTNPRSDQARTGVRTEPSDRTIYEPSEGESPPKRGGNPSKKGTRRRPSTPWPEGFHLDDDLADHASQKAGWDHARARAEFERFENHHRAKGSVFADWRAAWRTWVLNGIRFDRERAQQNGGPVIDQHGNRIEVPTGPPGRSQWGRRSNTDFAFQGGDGE